MEYGKWQIPMWRPRGYPAARHSLHQQKAPMGNVLVPNLRGPQKFSICNCILQPQNSLDLLGASRNSPEATDRLETFP